jgi:hypothetical protein
MYKSPYIEGPNDLRIIRETHEIGLGDGTNRLQRVELCRVRGEINSVDSRPLEFIASERG